MLYKLFSLVAITFLCLFSSNTYAKDAYSVRLTGQVEPGLQAYIQRVVKLAESNDGIVVLDIDTPGGRVDAALAIKNSLLDAQVPTVAYVNRNALSAGALIALSAEKLYMAPGGTIGAATPIIGDVTKKAPEKVVSALRSAFAGAAEARAKNPKIAKAMVDDSIEIAGISEKGKLLTLTSEEANKLKFSDGTASSLENALTLAGYTNINVLQQQPAIAEQIVRFITRGEVASLLMTIGFLALLLEFKGAGWGIAGLIAIACYGLLFWGHHIAGLAGGEEIAFIIVGVLLILLEILVIPGVGIAGIGGVGLLLYGLVMMLVGETVTGPAVVEAMTLVSISLILSVIGAVILLRLLFGKSSDSKLVLDNGYAEPNVNTPNTVKIGDTGITTTMLRPAGIALINGQRIDVVTQGDLMEAQQAVIVHSIEGNRVVVKALT